MLNVQPPTVVAAENVSAVVFDVPKNAVPIGAVAELQLAAVLKSPDAGLRSQVASCARAAPGAKAVTAASAMVASSAARRQFSRRHTTWTEPSSGTLLPGASALNLAVGENTLEKTIAKSIDGSLNPRALDKIDASTDHAHPG